MLHEIGSYQDPQEQHESVSQTITAVKAMHTSDEEQYPGMKSCITAIARATEDGVELARVLIGLSGAIKKIENSIIKTNVAIRYLVRVLDREGVDVLTSTDTDKVN